MDTDKRAKTWNEGILSQTKCDTPCYACGARGTMVPIVGKFIANIPGQKLEYVTLYACTNCGAIHSDLNGKIKDKER